MEKEIYIIDVYFDFRDSVGNAQYAFLVYANTKREAMKFLMEYLEDNNFMTARIDRYDIRILDFSDAAVIESPVIQMRS